MLASRRENPEVWQILWRNRCVMDAFAQAPGIRKQYGIWLSLSTGEERRKPLQQPMSGRMAMGGCKIIYHNKWLQAAIIVDFDN